MIDGIKINNVKNHLTFPVRAGIAAQSIPQLDHLFKSLNASNPVTFTIWSSDNDFVDVDKLREMIFYFGIEKVYIDVPKTLSDKLRLDTSGSGLTRKPNLVVTGLAIALLIILLFF